MNYNRTRLREAREAAGLSQGDLARLLNRTLGYARPRSRATVWWWEHHGDDLPTVELTAIASLLGLDLEELCCDDE